MPGNASLTFRLDQELKDRLEELAQSTKRTKSYLAAEAVREFLDHNAWQVAKIQKAVEYADQGGKFYSQEEIQEWLESWGTDQEKPPPQ